MKTIFILPLFLISPLFSEDKKEEIKLPPAVVRADEQLKRDLEAAVVAYNRAVEQAATRYKGVLDKEIKTVLASGNLETANALNEKKTGIDTLIAAAKELQVVKVDTDQIQTKESQQVNIIGMILTLPNKGDIIFEKDEFIMDWDRKSGKRKWTHRFENNELLITLYWASGEEIIRYNKENKTFITQRWGVATIKNSK